jgi:hypothetical protein
MRVRRSTLSGDRVRTARAGNCTGWSFVTMVACGRLSETLIPPGRATKQSRHSHVDSCGRRGSSYHAIAQRGVASCLYRIANDRSRCPAGAPPRSTGRCLGSACRTCPRTPCRSCSSAACGGPGPARGASRRRAATIVAAGGFRAACFCSQPRGSRATQYNQPAGARRHASGWRHCGGCGCGRYGSSVAQSGVRQPGHQP